MTALPSVRAARAQKATTTAVLSIFKNAQDDRGYRGQRPLTGGMGGCPPIPLIFQSGADPWDA